MKTILVTGSGAPGTIEILRTLRTLGRYRIVALDASRYAYGLTLGDAAYVVPRTTAPEYRQVLESIVEREKPDYIVPTLDEEIVDIHRWAAAWDARVLTPDPAICELFLDKWKTYEALADAEIPTPETWLGADAGRAVFPAVVKPRDGWGSRGLAYVESRSELERYLRDAPLEPSDYVIQRRLEGREFTVSVVVALGGPLLAVVPKEIHTKRGLAPVGVTRDCPAIDWLCESIQDRLRPDGPFNVQLIVTPDGIPCVFEINPRYSATAGLTIAAGVHEVDLVIRRAEGEQIEYPVEFTPDLMMVRYYTQAYMPESAWPIQPPERRGTPAWEQRCW